MLQTDYSKFIHTSRYARWISEESRRETWKETVERYIEEVVKPKIPDESVVKELEEAV